MSRENVDLYERGVAAMNARGFTDELAEELLTPGFRMENTTTAVTDKTYVGAEGVREWIKDMFEAFDDESRYETEEIVADGENFVVARNRIVGHGARSGAPVTLRWASVVWFRGGKMTRTAGYLRRQEALKAVGLVE
jgi:ketosteroid isomerase-like protein